MTTATAETSSSTSQEANLEPTEAIANLLLEAEEENAETTDEQNSTEETANTETQTEEEETTTEDSDDVEEQTEESTEETGESDDVEATWGNVLGIDEDKLHFDEDGNVSGVTVKVNGESSVVPMNELVAGFQLNKAVTQKSQALSEERKNFEQQRDEVVNGLRSRLDEVNAMAGLVEQQLLSEYEAIDWEKVRIENPAEYAALRQDFSTRVNQVETIKQTILQKQSEDQQMAQSKAKEERKAYLDKQWEQMLTSNPTWADKKSYDQDMGQMKDFCSMQYGFTDKDFQFVTDARLIELIKDARKYHAGMKIANKKITKPVPQFQKSSGRAQRSGPTKLQKLTKAAKSAKGAEKRRAQADAVAEVLLGG